MQKFIRPQSAKCKRTLKPYHQSNNNQNQQGYLLDINEYNQESIQILGNARSKTPVVDTQITKNNTQTQKSSRKNSSSSKFLHKFQQIKIYRETGSLTQNQLKPTLSLQIPETNQNVLKQFKIQIKCTKNRPKTPIKHWDIKEGQDLMTLQKRGRGLVHDNNRPISARKYSSLPILDISDFIFKIQKDKQKQTKQNQSAPPFKKQEKSIKIQTQVNGKDSINKHIDSSKPNSGKSNRGLIDQKRQAKIAYLQPENKFVSLFPLEKSQTINIQHQNLLPIYAEVYLGRQRFLISDQYENYSLRNMFQEFKVLGQTLAKRYLRQIALGLHHLHFHNKSHNCITPDSILYNKSGSLFINMLQAIAIPQKDQIIKHKKLYYFSPDFLLQRRRNQPKNDVWGLGCLAIQMITGKSPVNSSLHPYNHSHYSPNQQTMIDNVKERYKDLFKTNQNQMKEKRQVKISESAQSFIFECLKILKDQRPKILTLLQHQFLE